MRSHSTDPRICGKPLRRFVSCAGLGIFLLAGLFALGCEEGTVIVYQNETREVLFASLNQDEPIEIKPGSEREILYGPFRHDDAVVQIEITDTNDCVVLSRVTTVGELGEKSTLVVQESDIPPPDERTNCVKEDARPYDTQHLGGPA